MFIKTRVMADTDCASESASSVGDEERVRRLFQACDVNGDGYIDSQDLLAICRELSLEDSLDELMLQLGADSQGRISYEQFLQRRLALRPEIDALKNSNNKDNISDHSQGKLDRWEWDSGARDMSPVPKSMVKTTGIFTEDEFKASSRYTYNNNDESIRSMPALPYRNSSLSSTRSSNNSLSSTRSSSRPSSMSSFMDDSLSSISSISFRSPSNPSIASSSFRAPNASYNDSYASNRSYRKNASYSGGGCGC